MTHEEFFCTDDRVQPTTGARLRIKLKDGRQYENISLILPRPSKNGAIQLCTESVDYEKRSYHFETVAVIFSSDIVSVEEYFDIYIKMPDKNELLEYALTYE